MWLCVEGVERCAVFQIVAVGIWSFGKGGESGGRVTLVSHVSHRWVEKGCEKQRVYVKSAVLTAWNKGLE
jgi:hypothetical protein